MRDIETTPAISGSSRSSISVALLAGIAFVPIIVAAGFLTDRGDPTPPNDISVAQLRGALDHGTIERPPIAHAAF